MPPIGAILAAMARENKPLTRYQLQLKLPLLARQTIYDWIRRMKILGWVSEIKKQSVKRYELTDLGLFRAAKYGGGGDPLLLKNILRELGHKYEEYDKMSKLGRQQRVEELTKLISQVLQSGKAPPGWHLRLEMKADQHGNVKSWERWGFPMPRTTRRRHFPFN